MLKPLRWLKKYFIPHKHNDFKPHFFRYESTLFVLFVVLVIEIAFIVQVFVVFDKTNFLASVLPGVLTTLTNEERAQNDAAPLVENDLLSRAAQLKANDMAKNGYFAHTSPDGKTPWYWFDQVGYKYSSAGENLAVNFFDSNDVAQAWMNSPTHRENIVKKKYTEIGIGVASGVYEGRNTVFVAQLFGTPLATASTIPEAIKNTSTTVTPSIKPQPKAGQPPAEKTPAPKVTPKPAPAPINPQTVATAPVPPDLQVLGEEVDSSTVTENSIISKIKVLVGKALTSPREYIAYIYGVIALFVILAMLLFVFIKRELQHPIMLGRGLAIVVVIGLLVYVNMQILSVETKVPSDNLSASVIAY